MNTKASSPASVIAWRKTAVVAGTLYLITHVTSVGASVLYGPVLNNPTYIISLGPDNQVLLGAFFEVILALAIVGTAVALFPVVKWQNEGVAIGYVGLRTLEAAIIAVGVVPILALVALRQQLTGTVDFDTGATVLLSSILVALHNWTLILGPGFVCGTNTVLMAFLLYKSRLVPRFIPILGLVGGPLIFAYHATQLFSPYGQVPAWAAIAVVPIFAWELSLAIWMIAKGFKLTPISSGPAMTATNGLLNSA